MLRCRSHRGQAKPRFVETENPVLLELAEQLLAVYRLETRPTRGEIAEATTPLVNGADDVVLARGLNKLLLDRSRFDHADDLDYASLRRQLFEVSAAALQVPNDRSLDEFRELVRSRSELPDAFLPDGIYADLPDFEELGEFRELSPRELLERYNVALVQGLLLYANSLSLAFPTPNPAKMRRLLKYLKFFRLLARVEADPGRAPKDLVNVHVDGPASVLGSNKKYGLQLASFFPAVCGLDRWQLEAEVKWRDRALALRLDEKAGLVGHYRHFGAHVPEEIRLFHRQFTKTVTEWKIVGKTPFLDGGNQELIFPDLSFRGLGKRLVHMELFHRWHETPLRARLRLGQERPDLPLIVGVDRYLYNKPAIREELDACEWFARHGFLFRDYPPVSRVRACLERLTDGEAPPLLLDIAADQRP